MFLPQDYALIAMLNNWSVSIRRVTILGSTGSIGTQALEVIDQHRSQFEVIGLSGHQNVKLLIEQIEKFEPKYVSVTSKEIALQIQNKLKNKKIELFVGEDASSKVASLKCDVVLNAISGSAGLKSSFEALKANNQLALANKESLVIGGEVISKVAEKNQIIPVDSEHSAIAQCLKGEKISDVKKLILTASGGPFRNKNKSELKNVTAKEALAHPTWSMGKLVTINSATLMNKALEVIEAHLLFGIDYENIEVVIHPQSVIHSMVEFKDGSTLAQASPPNMKIPIALALKWESRLENIFNSIDWSKSHEWNFQPVDHENFDFINLSKKVGKISGGAPIVMNAVNEVCVDRFLRGEILFTDIFTVVNQVVNNYIAENDFLIQSLNEILELDSKYRRKVSDLLNNTKNVSKIF